MSAATLREPTLPPRRSMDGVDVWNVDPFELTHDATSPGGRLVKLDGRAFRPMGVQDLRGALGWVLEQDQSGRGPR